MTFFSCVQGGLDSSDINVSKTSNLNSIFEFGVKSVWQVLSVRPIILFCALVTCKFIENEEQVYNSTGK